MELATGFATSQASSAASSVSSGLTTIWSEAQSRAGLLARGGTPAPVVADGTRCELCGEVFGWLNRRQTCSSCDRFLCAVCLGTPKALAGMSCFCSAVCASCREQSQHACEFMQRREELERGVSVAVTVPPQKATPSGGFFSTTLVGGSPGVKKVPSWLSVSVDKGEILWHSLESRRGQPAHAGVIAAFNVMSVRNTGLAVELSVKGQGLPTSLEFGTSAERDTWYRLLELSVGVLTPESERAAQATAKADHRQQELEQRRLQNEERKQQLSQNLGMRFTAEAMLARGGK